MIANICKCCGQLVLVDRKTAADEAKARAVAKARLLADVRRCYKAGESVTVMAIRLGVTERKIYNWCKGIGRPRFVPAVKPEKVKALPATALHFRHIDPSGHIQNTTGIVARALAARSGLAAAWGRCE